MLDTLKFVQSAVARKDFVPTLTHFRIGDGTILGYNGEIAISNPIDLNLECCPKAVEFTKAIQTCRGTTQFQMVRGKLRIQSGEFTAFVPCLAEQYPTIAPDGESIAIDGQRVLGALRTLAPFIAVDASRPWARGVLFRGASAFATNNITLVEKWLGVAVPEVNVPEAAVKVLLKINEAPISLQIGKTSITFHYEKGRWIRCQLLTTEWPDVGRILDRESKAAPIPEGFFQALEDLIPFLEETERCFLQGGEVSTVKEAESGARVSLSLAASVKACFNAKQLLLLKGVAESFDLLAYPAPSLFFGKEVRGAAVGIHVEGFTAA